MWLLRLSEKEGKENFLIILIQRIRRDLCTRLQVNENSIS